MSASMRSLFDKELSSMSEAILLMSSKVEKAIEQAIAALAEGNVELARQVIADDAEINRLRYLVEEQAQLVLATQAPTAGDLRRIIAAIHIASELERIGDHASGIARIVVRIDEVPSTNLDWSRLPKMAKRAETMLHEAITAFTEGDAEVATAIAKRDQKINRHYRKFFGEAVAHMSEEEKVQMATYMLWVAHNLERIGDRSTNIAERVVFMVTGEYIEVAEDYA